MSSDSRFFAQVRSILCDDDTSICELTDLSCVAGDVRVIGVPDVIVLDRRLGSDTYRRMRRLRRRWPTSAILVANAEHERECAQFLDEGADDVCLAGSSILPSRLNAVARRARALNADTRIVFGDLIVDREHRRAWSAGTELSLSPREYDLLLCLFYHAPRSVGREALTALVWSNADPPTPNAIEVYVCYLRRKLTCNSKVVINTVRGVGYALAVAVP